MRISDWSSDVCSSDLAALLLFQPCCLPCCEALGLEVLRQLGSGQAEVALHGGLEGRGHTVGRHRGRAGHRERHGGGEGGDGATESGIRYLGTLPGCQVLMPPPGSLGMGRGSAERSTGSHCTNEVGSRADDMKSVTIAGRAEPLSGRLHGRGEVCVRGGLRETAASELRKQSCRKSTYWASPAPSWAASRRWRASWATRSRAATRRTSRR